MRAHLTTIDGIDASHGFLDEGVTGFTLLSTAASGLGYIDGIPCQAGIVNNDLIARLRKKR